MMAVGDDRDVLHELLVVEEVEERLELARVAVDDGEREDAAVRVAVTRGPAPGRVRALQHVHHRREGRVGREREPVAQRLHPAPELLLEVCGHAGQRVALPLAHRVRYVLVAAREGDGLEGDGLDLVDVLGGELDDAADVVVVDGVDDGRD
jgi:hypothetical protein